MDGTQLYSMLLGLGGGGVTVGSVAWFLIQRYLDSRDRAFEAMAAKLEAKAGAEIADIKARVRDIEDGCQQHSLNQQSARMETSLTHINQGLTRVENLVQRFTEDLARANARIDGHDGYIGSVSRDIREHKSDHAIHGGGHKQ
jgi:hypothetical protein